MPRRTKIVATVGPACQDETTLAAMVEAGMNVARVSLAHGRLDDHLEQIARVRRAAGSTGAIVGVLADLPGPKVRAAPFPEGGVFLAEGMGVTLAVAVNGGGSSTAARIEVDDSHLLEDLQLGDRVVLGDGAIDLRVEGVGDATAAVSVVGGGRLQGRPGVTVPTTRLPAVTPTPSDLALLDALGPLVDAVAISFVRSAEDVRRVREAAGDDAPLLVAKIETQEAVDDLEAIITYADGVMVARGDLGVRCALEDVPHYQKHIVRTCVAFGRPVITATQMLESMTNAPTPTRAEVSDIANAVFDGADAVMLSAETAIGHDPVAAVRTMARVAERAEREADYVQWGGRLGKLQSAQAADAPVGHRISSAITAAAWRAALEIDAAAIICCTRRGATARAIARFRPTAPLLAVTPFTRTAHQLSFSWGVDPVAIGEHASTDDIVWFSVQEVARRGLVRPGDVVAVLAGSPEDPEPTTDVLRLVRVR